MMWTLQALQGLTADPDHHPDRDHRHRDHEHDVDRDPRAHARDRHAARHRHAARAACCWMFLLESLLLGLIGTLGRGRCWALAVATGLNALHLHVPISRAALPDVRSPAPRRCTPARAGEAILLITFITGAGGALPCAARGAPAPGDGDAALRVTTRQAIEDHPPMRIRTKQMNGRRLPVGRRSAGAARRHVGLAARAARRRRGDDAGQGPDGRAPEGRRRSAAQQRRLARQRVHRAEGEGQGRRRLRGRRTSAARRIRSS